MITSQFLASSSTLKHSLTNSSKMWYLHFLRKPRWLLKQSLFGMAAMPFLCNGLVNVTFLYQCFCVHNFVFLIYVTEFVHSAEHIIKVAMVIIIVALCRILMQFYLQKILTEIRWTYFKIIKLMHQVRVGSCHVTGKSEWYLWFKLDWVLRKK